MSTDADELAKAVGNISPRRVLVLFFGCAAIMAAVSGSVAAYRSLGGPIPATREFVTAQVRSVEDNVEVLAESLRQTQQLVLGDKWWRLQEKIEELESQTQTNMLRDQIRRLRRDQAGVQRQMDALDKNGI